MLLRLLSPFMIVIFWTQLSFADDNRFSNFEWEELEPGFSIGNYLLPSTQNIIRSQVLLLKFDPKLFSLHIASAKDLGLKRSNMKVLTKHLGGVCGMNANFFDPEEHPLGIVISDFQEINPIHRGGNLLTHIFGLRKKTLFLESRKNFQKADVSLAFQSGPALIYNGVQTKIQKLATPTRRSGIALTKKNELILFVTILRFPGATLQQIQNMLLDKQLGSVTEALNLDGGGSSQMYVKATPKRPESFVTGGDVVPIGLVIKRKKNHG